MCKTGLAILGHGKFSTIMNLIHEWAGMPPMFVGQAKDAKCSTGSTGSTGSTVVGAVGSEPE